MGSCTQTVPAVNGNRVLKGKKKSENGHERCESANVEKRALRTRAKFLQGSSGQIGTWAEAQNIFRRHARDLTQAFVREKSLVRSNQHVGKGQQPRQFIVQ